MAKQRRPAQRRRHPPERSGSAIVKRPATENKGDVRRKAGGSPTAPNRRRSPSSRRSQQGRASRRPPRAAAAPRPRRSRPESPGSTKRSRCTSGASRRCSATITPRRPSSSAPSSSDIPTNASCSNAPGCICESANAKPPGSRPPPKTAAERVYAATVALNSGDHAGALDHLQRALGGRSESDHAHYIMAVGAEPCAAGATRRSTTCAGNCPESGEPVAGPQDPDLDSIRAHPLPPALDTPPAQRRRRSRSGAAEDPAASGRLTPLDWRSCPTSTSSSSPPARARG